MIKLLRANFFGLRRCRALWLCMAGAFLLSTAFLLRLEADGDPGQTLDQMFLQVFPFLAILHAVFISLFLGVEYQDGTLRNKLIAGHSRGKVYLSFLLTAIAGCFAILLAWGLSVGFGILKFGWFTAPAGSLLLSVAVILLLTAAEAALLTLLCMLLTNRAIAAVTAILLMFGLIILGSAFYNALCEPETLSAAIMTGDGFQVGPPEPNPRYISGMTRQVFQFAVDALPTGQAILLANGELMRPGLSLLASAGILLLAGAAGLAIFQRKDLK